MLENKYELENWLNEHDVVNYTIQDDLTVDAESISLVNNNLLYLPFKLGNIQSLALSYNGLSEIEFPKLPESLKHLDISNNKFKSLPPLPSGLVSLHCDNNQLTDIKELPPSLVSLTLGSQNIKSILFLPNSLESLDLSHTDIESIDLPPELKEVNLSKTKIKSIVFPNQLLKIDMSETSVAMPHTLPNHLIEFYCSKQDSEYLPILPSTLEKLDCSFNKLKVLNDLPQSLSWLRCSNNEIEKITLPLNLTYLAADNNLLTEIDLPKNLENIWLSNNKLKTLVAPPSAKVLNITNNLFESFDLKLAKNLNSFYLSAKDNEKINFLAMSIEKVASKFEKDEALTEENIIHLLRHLENKPNLVDLSIPDISSLNDYKLTLSFSKRNKLGTYLLDTIVKYEKEKIEKNLTFDSTQKIKTMKI